MSLPLQFHDKEQSYLLVHNSLQLREQWPWHVIVNNHNYHVMKKRNNSVVNVYPPPPFHKEKTHELEVLPSSHYVYSKIERGLRQDL